MKLMKTRALGMTFVTVFAMCMTSVPTAMAANKPVNITIWIPDTSTQNAIYNKALAEFNKQYASKGITATAQFFDWSDYPEKLTVAMNGGVGPDILFNGAAATAGLVESKEVMPLNRFYSKAPLVKKINSGYEAQTVYKGKSYFVPTQAGVLVLEYRKDFFKKAHLGIPKNWTQLLNDAKKLTVKGQRVGFSLATSGISLEQDYSEFLFSNGGNFVDKSGSHATLDTPAAIGAMNEYSAFFKDGAASIKFTPASGTDPIGTGQAAMELASGNLTTIKAQYPKVYNEIGFIPFPAGPLAKHGVAYAAANGFYISSETKHPQQAWTVLQYLLQKSTSMDQQLGAEPVLSGSQNAAWIKGDPEWRTMYNAIGASKLQGNPNIAAWINVRNTFAQDAQAVLYGQSVSTVMKKANSDVQQQIDQG